MGTGSDFGAVFSNQHSFRVIYGDTDMAGIVYYGNYLRYFEAGRNELLRAAGLEYKRIQAAGCTFPVADVEVKYRSPAHYDDELTLMTTLEQVRTVSLRISYRLERSSDRTLIATGATTHACVDTGGKLMRLPEEIRARLLGAAGLP